MIHWALLLQHSSYRVVTRFAVSHESERSSVLLKCQRFSLHAYIGIDAPCESLRMESCTVHEAFIDDRPLIKMFYSDARATLRNLRYDRHEAPYLFSSSAERNGTYVPGNSCGATVTNVVWLFRDGNSQPLTIRLTIRAP